jgi:hypothetical protein
MSLNEIWAAVWNYPIPWNGIAEVAGLLFSLFFTLALLLYIVIDGFCGFFEIIGSVRASWRAHRAKRKAG